MKDFCNMALLTDLYQLTMVQAYLGKGMEETAVFEFYVRNLPENRSFLIAQGLESVVHYLETLRFTEDDLAWLSNDSRFRKPLLDYLQSFRFSGDVQAMAEGTVFFANEPILRVVAPLPQAQLVETRLVQLLQYPILVGTKAARIKQVAGDRLLVDFGLRRAHGAEAGLTAAKASYAAGFAGTSTIMAGSLYDIPLFGTVAHSFIQSFEYEEDAFQAFAQSQQDNIVFLIDTYNVQTAVDTIIRLSPRLSEKQLKIKAVRIDSGDFEKICPIVRQKLDAAGLHDVGIFLSGNMDEYIIEALVSKGVPVNGFGVGTKMITSSDAPYLECAYKLTEYQGIPKRKRSEGKASLPGRKQVIRYYTKEGLFDHDEIALEHEFHRGHGLIQPVMIQGHRAKPLPSLNQIRDYIAEQLKSLPSNLLPLDSQTNYPVHVTDLLKEWTEKTDKGWIS